RRAQRDGAVPRGLGRAAEAPGTLGGAGGEGGGVRVARLRGAGGERGGVVADQRHVRRGFQSAVLLQRVAEGLHRVGRVAEEKLRNAEGVEVFDGGRVDGALLNFRGHAEELVVGRVAGGIRFRAARDRRRLAV